LGWIRSPPSPRFIFSAGGKPIFFPDLQELSVGWTGLIGAAVGLFFLAATLIVCINAWILRVSVKIAEDVKISTVTSILTAFIVLLAHGMLSLPVVYFLKIAKASSEVQATAQAVLWPLSFLLQSWLIAEINDLRFARAALINVFMTIATVIIWFIFAFSIALFVMPYVFVWFINGMRLPP
jgi:hypothetical protein